MATQTTQTNDIDAVDVDVGVDEEVPTETKEAEAGEIGPEESSCIQRYGKRVGVAAAIVVLLLIVISLSIYISVSNQVGQNNKDISHTTTIISAADGEGVTSTIIYEEVIPGQSQEEDEEDEETVQGEGLVNVPKKLIDFIEKVVTTSPGSDGYRRLNIPTDMIDRMNGNCEYWHMYEPADTTNGMQCDSHPRKENFPLVKGGGNGYRPSDKTIRYLSEATGVSIEALRSIQIGSGVEDSEPGLWCSMPIPGDVDEAANQNAINYWKTCVQPKAGFFNALQCKGRCTDPDDIKTCSTLGSIGFAAVEEGVCYPAHQHMAEEGYWQIAGRGWWRTWLDLSDFDDDRQFVSSNNRVGSNYSFFPQRQEVPHELDTTNDLDGRGGGEVADGMLMVYFWGLSNDVKNNYRHNTDVRHVSTAAQVGVGNGSCGNNRRIPPYNASVPVTIGTNNC